MPKTTPAPCIYRCGRVATVRIEETFDYPSELRCAVCVRDTSRRFTYVDQAAAYEQLAEEREREAAYAAREAAELRESAAAVRGDAVEPREITDAEAAAAMRPSVTGEQAWAELVEKAGVPKATRPTASPKPDSVRIEAVCTACGHAITRTVHLQTGETVGFDGQPFAWYHVETDEERCD